MVNVLSENEILNYLMTSEFIDGLTPDEFIFLLKQFRYQYRLANGKFENSKYQIDKQKEEIDSLKLQYENTIKSITIDKQKAEKEYNRLVGRKLSWKERFSGKIIINKNEIK
jgi:hypothetical protein